MLMAKLALDIDAKHDPDYIASWDYDDIPKKTMDTHTFI